jgi:replicative DNA helicase
MNQADRMKRETELAVYHGEDEVLPAYTLGIQAARERQGKKTLSTGLSSLDKLIGGFEPGQLVDIIGPTGMGKTTTGQTFTYHLVDQDQKTLWFSYEMDTLDFLEKFHPGHLSCIFMPKRMTKNTLLWIEDRIMEAKLKYGVTAVFIDHLHYLVDMNPRLNLSSQVGVVVRHLKQLAVTHKVVLFLLCHTVKVTADEEPGLGFARDSSFVEQEADTVLYVWRDSKDDGKTTILKVAKNRKKGIVNKRIPLTYCDGRYYDKAL